MPDFLPRADAGLLAWTANFAYRLSVDYERYHVDPIKAAEYLALQDEFARGYQTAIEPGSRTPVSVNQKNTLRAKLKTATRSLASPIRANRAVSESDLILLGLHRPSKPRRAFSPPGEPPKVWLKALGGRRIKVMLRDAQRTSSRARPRDVFGAIVFMRVGENVQENPNPWRYKTQTRQVDFDLEIKEFAPPGTRVWVSAQWMIRRGTTGPQSEPVCVRLSFDELVIPRPNAA